MAEQKILPQSPSFSPPDPESTPQREESGSKMALKVVVWLLLFPTAVVLLIKWLMHV
jgi:hypothetical protein